MDIFRRKSILRVSVLIPILLSFFIISCTKESSVASYEDDTDTWTFKGVVVNGLTVEGLQGAVVTFTDRDNVSTSDTSDSEGHFSISGIPAGQAHFTVSYSGSATIPYTKIVINDASGVQGANTEEDLLTDQSQTISLFPRNGAISGTLKAQNDNGAANSFIVPGAYLTLTYNIANMSPAVFTAVTDSTGKYSFDSLPVTGTNPALTAAPISLNGEVYAFNTINITNMTEGYNVPQVDQIMTIASNIELEVLASNVLSADGIGLNDVPVDISPYYVLSEALDPTTIEISDNGADFDAVITISGDTLTIDPVNNFAYGDVVDFIIYGQTTSGKYVTLNLSSADRDFKTEKAIFVVASNTIDAAGNAVSGFPIYGEMWVKFSEALDTNLSEILWASAPNAANDLYANGISQPNSTVRVSGDTLFVKPDNRIALGYSETVGFRVNVQALTGRTSGYLEFYATIEESDFYIVSTNTLDSLGETVEDFGLRDTVIIVASQPILEITSISGNGNTTPVDLTLDNVTLSATGDTIWYVPAIKLNGRTTYGIDFNVTLETGIKLANQLSVTWNTVDNLRIISTNNRDASTGLFRPFKVIGDSLVVKFSRAIDTSATAPTPFSVNDWYGNIDYVVTWSADLTTATIKNTDTIAAGGYDADAYESGAATAAYTNIDFAVTAANGEEISSLTPTNTALEIHTEQELWLVNSSALANVNSLRPVDVGTTGAHRNGEPDTLAEDATITLVFNRAVDTTVVKADAVNLYNNFIQLNEDGSSIDLEFALTFSADAKTITLDPVSNFEAGSKYDITLTDIPAVGIKEVFDGNGENNTLVENTTNANDWDFIVTPEIIDISALTVTISADTNSGANVLNNRVGYSPAGNYSGDVATAGHLRLIITESAWNANHADSVDGYQIRVRKTGGDWFISTATEATGSYSTFDPTNGMYQTGVDVNLAAQAFYTADYLLTADMDDAGTDYINGASLFNSGETIEVQARAVLNDDGSGEKSYGVWSSSVSFTDNVAPCDSDFVSNYNNTANGGVDVTESAGLDFNNSSSDVDSSEYIDIKFPEDMDVTGSVPTITFYYGSFTTTEDPTVAPSANSSLSKWINGRTYRMYINVPVDDYTDGGSGDGAFYNISVAGCSDASGVAIVAHGSAGADAESTFDTDDTNLNQAAVIAGAKQVQGSASVINGFMLCN